jgi:putative nucleotidyltransferase with HDIG domain
MLSTELRLDRFLFNLNALAELGEETTSPKEFQRVVKSALYMVMGTFSSSKGAILRYDNEKKSMRTIVTKGLAGVGEDFEIGFDEGAAKKMFERGRPLDIRACRLPEAMGAELEKAGLSIITPLVVKDEFLGLLSINDKLSGEEFTEYDFRLLSAMAQHIAVSLHSQSLLKKLIHKYNENKVLYENLRQIYYDTVHAFAAAIDAKDAYTKGHSHRVSAYCSTLAREMGLGDDEVEGIRIAGLLHDIGKIAIDKTIINKPTPLTDNESMELSSHPVVGYDILSKVKFPWKGIQRMIRNHHEKLDGTGYPDRLLKSRIPLGAKMMALVDAFDAMTTDRPYRRRLSLMDVMVEIKENLGRQFDPVITRSFLSVIRKEVAGEVAHPAIIPHLVERVDLKTINMLLKSFPALP